MAVRLVCRACGKRLKLPDGTDRKRSAKCPKCLAHVDLSAALEASAYLPTVAIPTMAVPPAKPQAAERKPPPRAGEDDPLPYPAPKIAPPKSAPAPKIAPPPLPQASPHNSGGLRTPPASPREPPPLAEVNGRTNTPPPATTDTKPLSLDDEGPLSLDDDDQPGAPEPEPPFRVPVWVLADSLQQIVGPCFAVLVPHGLFLEHEPMKPFLYVPVGSRAEAPGPGELLVTLPDRRAVTLRFRGRAQRALARDTRAFLLGERPVPFAADYRRKWWMLWAALIFSLGLAGGPLVLSQITNLGLEFGLKVGAGFALAGLLANAAVALFSRWSPPGQLAAMACVCALVTGVFLFGTAAYLAGKRAGTEETKADPPQPPPSTPGVPGLGPSPPGPNPLDPPAPPMPPGPRAPSHVDRAYTNGVSVLDDGPAEVTALTIAADGNTLGIGHADGTTRLCLLDQPTFDSILPGPKADAPVKSVLFDSSSRFVFALTANSAIATTRGGPFTTLAKIPGAPIAVAPELSLDRVRIAAVRGNQIQHRFLSTAFIVKPPAKAKDAGIAYAFPAKGDEVTPGASGPDPQKPGGAAGPAFLAWTPNGKLFAGQADGTILIWSNTMRPEPANRDHRAAVKAWADCAGTGDSATGDEQGNVAVWPFKGGKPTVASVLVTPIAALSFAPSGAWLAVADNTGWLVIWDVAAGKAVHRVKRPTPAKAMAFGPNDDVLILGAGKTVEVWSLPELVK